LNSFADEVIATIVFLHNEIHVPLYGIEIGPPLRALRSRILGRICMLCAIIAKMDSSRGFGGTTTTRSGPSEGAMYISGG
jgi:hypothetical protein